MEEFGPLHHKPSKTCDDCKARKVRCMTPRVICYFGFLILCVTNGITADKQPSTGLSPRELYIRTIAGCLKLAQCSMPSKFIHRLSTGKQEQQRQAPE
ncbi:hypothetical protein DM02DRAFT_387682 [Periconia macrospinosa]|uniref:Uncharacterized protein n=1 Tax=Periconia macrospinosa TaxID=97972 RepID=A0A2V1DRQ5_9PLEO|nr:hypothetical protein DM02DRAFT_387682 [Periconia macrospinosa]